MIKGIERVAPILNFAFRGVEVKLRGVRQNKPPKMVGTIYELIVDTDESDRRLDLLHENVRKFGTTRLPRRQSSKGRSNAAPQVRCT